MLAHSLVAAGVYAQGTPLPVELLPLGKDLGLRSGQTVTPAYEGWYENEDGSLALSFGYYNRNTEEVVNIPIGPSNRIVERRTLCLIRGSLRVLKLNGTGVSSR